MPGSCDRDPEAGWVATGPASSSERPQPMANSNANPMNVVAANETDPLQFTAFSLHSSQSPSLGEPILARGYQGHVARRRFASSYWLNAPARRQRRYLPQAHDSRASLSYRCVRVEFSVERIEAACGEALCTQLGGRQRGYGWLRSQRPFTSNAVQRGPWTRSAPASTTRWGALYFMLATSLGCFGSIVPISGPLALGTPCFPRS